MKYIKIISLVLIVLLSALLCAPVSIVAETKEATDTISLEKVQEARFLNILNHNTNYNDDFKSIDTIINNSVLSLLHLRDAEMYDYIREEYVVDFVKNMYGIEIENLSQINEEWPKEEGYIYIIPRGFSKYSHEFVSAKENEDGSFTVTTNLTVESHEGEINTFECKSLMVVNEASVFGYSLINSNFSMDK